MSHDLEGKQILPRRDDGQVGILIGVDILTSGNEGVIDAAQELLCAQSKAALKRDWLLESLSGLDQATKRLRKDTILPTLIANAQQLALNVAWLVKEKTRLIVTIADAPTTKNALKRPMKMILTKPKKSTPLFKSSTKIVPLRSLLPFLMPQHQSEGSRLFAPLALITILLLLPHNVKLL